VNKSFEKLFKFLLSRNLVALGLYRLQGARENEYPYVYTNPKPLKTITSRDRVFVLGRNIAKDLITDPTPNREGKDATNQEGGPSKCNYVLISVFLGAGQKLRNELERNKKPFYANLDKKSKPKQKIKEKKEEEVKVEEKKESQEQPLNVKGELSPHDFLKETMLTLEN
jgi:hypothetical protein